LHVLQAQAGIYFSNGIINGRTFLDVGCWDGFNSIEANRLGASRVLATDKFAWSPQCWGRREAFDLARNYLAPDIEMMEIDIPELTPDKVGVFDVVLFAGVLYHLRHPFAGLEHISRLVGKCLIVETHVDALDIPRPAMIFYPTNELANDPTNWWGPNYACVEAMLRDVGFQKIERTIHPFYSTRAIFKAWRA